MKRFSICLLFIFLTIFADQKPTNTKYTVTRLPFPVNTDHQDFSPSTIDGIPEGYFYSKRNGRDTEIYSFTLKKDSYSVKNIKILNSEFDDQSPYIFNNGKSLLFSSNRNGSAEFIIKSGLIGVSRDLYYSEMIEGNWTQPIRLPESINTEMIEENPAFLNDVLYFVRYPFGNHAKAKIYMSLYKNGNWSSVKSIPLTMNENDSYITPGFSSDGKFFYFSSNMPGGYGGYDLYKSEYNDGVFGNPVNLGSDINTEKDEACFSPDPNGFYFCRKMETTGYDIFFANGSDVIEKDKIFQLKNIQFEINSSILSKGSISDIKRLAEFLEQNAKTTLHIYGHTDLNGDPELNQKLSIDRAETVKQKLVDLGINKNRIFTKGYGSSKPIHKAKDEDSSKINRRVEFEFKN